MADHVTLSHDNPNGVEAPPTEVPEGGFATPPVEGVQPPVPGEGSGEEGNPENHAIEPTPEVYGKAIDNALATAGLEPNAIAQEYETNKALSDETYTALEGAGYPKDLVDAYISGLTAKQSSYDDEYYAMAGGEEAFHTAWDWAGAENSQFSAAIASDNPDIVKAGIAGLMATYQAANPVPNRVVGGATAGRSQAGTVKSVMHGAELLQEAKMTGDPVRVAEVEQMIMRSKF